ncbi:hypothetical protein K1T71_000444 [Dendrolimus kikuchii]|uniref:Uncharacterized protein n=1 Tax=Dendrolimus kikuchii TaxID=765133 RepID=A0ACC1DKN9_9NEOP|nr:hypothetical protein K1T71_000444 [Dendrolimus kikuchii]
MWFAGLAAILVMCMYLYLNTRKPSKFPPGPSWIPILGCAIEVCKVREKTGYLYKAVNEMTKTYSTDGHLLGLRIGKDRIVMVNSLEANKEMLFNEDIDGRPKGIFYQTRTWGERRGVLLTDGDLWKEQRRFLIKHLKGFGFGRTGMSKIATCEGKHMVEDVLTMIQDSEQNSVVLQMHNFFNVYILNTLWTMMAGLRYNPSDPQMKVLQALLFDLFAAIDMVGAVFSHFPILSVFMPTLSGYKDFVRTHKRIWKFLRDEIAKHKDSFEPEKEDRDFMDVYLRILREKGEIDTYSEGQLVAICMDMFMAGTETTAKSMSFGFSYLVREQDVQKKAQEEIDRVIGRERMPNMNDRTDNYTNILMDENYFPEPYSFNPERFLVDGRIVLPDHYFPFGLAKHRCMGDVLAKCNIFVFTATMLQHFSFLPAPGEPLSPWEHVDGATPSAAPFKALVLQRPKANL